MDPQDFYAYAAAGGLCIFLLYFLAPIAQRVGLIDRPSGRKQQLRPVALIGGIAIVMSFFLATLLMPISLTEYRVLYFCIVLLFVTGIVDDLRELPPAAKFVMQLIVALAWFSWTNNWYGLSATFLIKVAPMNMSRSDWIFWPYP